MTAAEKRVAEMRRHTALVVAVQDAIDLLLAPFTEDDPVPGNVTDAIEILRAALK